MSQITNFDELINSFNYAQTKAPTKFGGALGAVSGYWNSSWMMTGSYLASTPPSGSGAACDATTVGRVPFNNPGGSRDMYLSRFMFSPNQVIGAYLMDRQFHCSGLSGTTITSQTINSAALPARANGGEGNEMWVEIYTLLGATARTLTITYTNSDGTPGRTATVNLPASARPTSAYRVPLQSGDTGVESIQSAILSGSTGTAGNFGLVLSKRIASLAGTLANGMFAANAFDLGLPKIEADNCLFLYTNAVSTNSPTYDVELTTVEA